jgi:DNA polymerase III sliding clamp (beta) subunit (PCNA family)
MITLSVSSLKPALAGFAKIVSAKATLECLRCVRVDATPESVSITGTDLEMFASVGFPGVQSDTIESFLLPLDRLQSMARRLPANAFLYLEPDKISCDLGSGRVSENIDAPKVEEFPVEPVFEINTVPMPESFSRRFTEAMGCSSTDSTRYILNGIYLDSSSDSTSHYMVGTDGRHLFSANSFTLPLSESLTIPNHKILMWRGLADLPWALAGQRKSESTLARITAGDWTLTMKTIEGNYPNWRQVIPKAEQHRTTVALPEEHEFAKILNGLPGGESKDKPVDLVVENGSVSVKDPAGGSSVTLAGAKSKGADVTIRVNREYLTKAFAFGLTSIGIIDAISPLHFTCEGRQMVVMPLRVANEIATPAAETPPAPIEPQPTTNQTAPVEPQPERETTMPATNGHTNGAMPQVNGATRSTTLPETEKPSLEVAIEKLDAFKVTFRETLAGLTELTSLLKQSVRDQKAGEKEVHQVRQTLRSLQSVRI